MDSRLFKLLTILAAAALVAGCKLEVIAPVGGDITWEGGSCLAGNTCPIEITNAEFLETFTATPAAGYRFKKWLKAPGFFCGDTQAGDSCTVSMPSNYAEPIIATLLTGYVMPVYENFSKDTDNDGVADCEDWTVPSCNEINSKPDLVGCSISGGEWTWMGSSVVEGAQPGVLQCQWDCIGIGENLGTYLGGTTHLDYPNQPVGCPL